MTDDKTAVAYMLRTCKADMTSHDGFKWPESGPVMDLEWANCRTCHSTLARETTNEGGAQ